MTKTQNNILQFLSKFKSSTEEQLKLFNKNVLIIDVASTPGGINKESANKLGLKVITALGIPGKEMPRTAGKYIKETIDKLIKI